MLACRQAEWCAVGGVCSCREQVAVANRRIQLNASSRMAGLGPVSLAHGSGSKQGSAKRVGSKRWLRGARILVPKRRELRLLQAPKVAMALHRRAWFDLQAGCREA